MNSDLTKIIADIIGAVIAIVLAYIAPKLKAWLTVKIGESETNALYEDVKTLVKAAQQMYWNKTGVERKEYVLTQLKALGYELTNEVSNLIEKEVFDLPEKETENKSDE